MNKIITSKEEILAESKKIVAQKGLQAINMREVAKNCNVAVGSVYNYFPSKNDLLVSIIESVWKEIIQGISRNTKKQTFAEDVENIFYNIKNAGEKYPFFFGLHSVILDKNGRDKGRETMNSYFESIKSDLLFSLQRDENINENFFSSKCTQEDFIEFVFSNLLTLLIQNRQSCNVLTEIIKSAVYKI